MSLSARFADVKLPLFIMDVECTPCKINLLIFLLLYDVLIYVYNFQSTEDYIPSIMTAPIEYRNKNI